MFRIAIALLKRNATVILTLEFEALLSYLQQGLFDVYTPLAGDEEATEGAATAEDVPSLIHDSAAVRISMPVMHRLAREFMASHAAATDPAVLEAQDLRLANRTLSEKVKKMEGAYELLNREHIDSVARLALQDSQIEGMCVRACGLTNAGGRVHAAR